MALIDADGRPVVPPPFAVSNAFNGMDVAHGFFGRRGGVSRDWYESLNAGFAVGDNPLNIRDNRARIAMALDLPADAILSLKQIHSASCVAVDGPQVLSLCDRAEADAMVTDRAGVGLGVLTADCAPVLFAADGVVGAAHAGWGGALNGVLESTVDAMVARGCARASIRAAVGPCIGLASYEVSRGFEAPFLAEDASSERFFHAAKNDAKLMFDLSGYCAYRLARAGVTRVDIVGHDTCARESEYFSHRRTTLRGETLRGLQLSVIALK